jgi:succinoglycan biosynthesis transport protein ExoP
VNEAPRYATLRDYLQVLRRRRLWVLAFVLVFAGAAFAFSKAREAEYAAEAALSVRDVSEDVDLLTASGIPPQATPETLATVTADRATSPRVLRRVKRRLRTRLTTDQLKDRVTTNVEARTQFVVVQTRARNPRFAARLANAFADQIRLVTVREERARFARAGRSLRSQFDKAKRRGKPGRFTRELYAERISRVDALQQFSRPVELSRIAQVPKHPVSPRPARDTILGGILGLALGIVAAFVSDLLDRRLKGSHEVQKELGLPLLGYVSNKAMGNTLLTTNGDRAETETELEAFRIMRANLDFLDVDKPLRSLLVTSGLPEEGKTTVALALAGVYASSGRRTVVVEADLRKPVFARRLPIERAPGLTDHLAGKASLEQITQGVAVLSGAPTTVATQPAGSEPQRQGSRQTLSCISAGTEMPYSQELLGSDRFKGFLERLRSSYDVVIFDAAPLLPVVDTLELVPQVDAVLLCVRASRTTREQAKAAKEALDHFPPRPTGVVTTGLRRSDAEYYGYYSYSYSYESSS